jgi:F0F1-type ATP synthase membrane subunit c/vacuolar-type H+-ATPase subunit K
MNPLLVLRALWTAYFTAVGVYGLVLVMLPADGAVAVPAPLRWALMALAVGIAALTFRLRAAFAAAPFPPGSDRAQALVRLQTRCIVTWALCEAVAIFGLVLGFLGRDLTEFLPFAGAAAVLLYAHRPAVWPIETPGGPAA